MKKTKLIPPFVMLFAGFVLCIVSIVNGYDLFFLLRTLLIVLILFYFLGLIIQIIVEINFREKPKDVTADDLGFIDGEILEDEIVDVSMESENES